jgi:hypothetical protein
MPAHIPPWPPEFFSAGPTIISETLTHIVLAIEIPKTTLTHHRRFINQLARLAAEDSRAMTAARILTVAELSELAGRLVTASGLLKVARPLRTDLALAALVITTLIQTGVTAGPVMLGGRDG